MNVLVIGAYPIPRRTDINFLPKTPHEWRLREEDKSKAVVNTVFEIGGLFLASLPGHRILVGSLFQLG
jgi:hypothetical protein